MRDRYRQTASGYKLCTDRNIHVDKITEGVLPHLDHDIAYSDQNGPKNWTCIEDDDDLDSWEAQPSLNDNLKHRRIKVEVKPCIVDQASVAKAKGNFEDNCRGNMQHVQAIEAYLVRTLNE